MHYKKGHDQTLFEKCSCYRCGYYRFSKKDRFKGSVHYFLSIKYKDISGKIFTGNAIGSKKSIKGSTIAIMYKETDPAEYKTDFGKYLAWLLGFSFIFFGVIVWFCYWLLSVSNTTDPASYTSYGSYINVLS